MTIIWKTSFNNLTFVLPGIAKKVDAIEEGKTKISVFGLISRNEPENGNFF